MAVVYAIVVVAGAPLIGIWRGHKWAKSQGLRLRQDDAAERQTA